MVLPDSDGISRVPPYSGSTPERMGFGYGAVTLCGGPFQAASPHASLCNSKGVSYNPRKQASWFGLIPFRSPLLGESNFLSLPPGTKMFQFPGCAPAALWIHAAVLPHYGQWVSPFGNLRISAYLQLPGAYRCSFRPSSAPSAKASTVRPS